ncbi:hypothetical protein UNDYM_4075 [Undibacterium sp. YM2]|uniref:hypothetical protein n=1 Tax=Undibacterium sp. YM2 TaxID=2058625 RepID=UPI001331D440|nr:hypothetical protein [Undibacterium sp. YM2]BBB68328.1 hypothetical protein UNDYM_4075 [Undibacterium sp. YM2]
MQTKTHYLHGYHIIVWTDNLDLSLAPLIQSCPELVMGQHVAIAACDGGPYLPDQVEMARGWTLNNKLAVSPRVQDITDLPTPGFDEWYVYEGEAPRAQHAISVNRFGFSVLDEQSEQARVFWSQVENFQPLHVLGAGVGSMFVLSRDEQIHRQLQKIFMMHTDIPDPAAFFLALGGLHDTRFHASANPSDKTLTLEIDDINANFLGLPEYPGKEPALFIFSNVAGLDMNYDVDDASNCRIYDMEIKTEWDARRSTMNISISPGGRLSFLFSTVKRVTYFSKSPL